VREFRPTGISEKGIKIIVAGILQVLFLETMLKYGRTIGQSSLPRFQSKEFLIELPVSLPLTFPVEPRIDIE